MSVLDRDTASCNFPSMSVCHQHRNIMNTRSTKNGREKERERRSAASSSHEDRRKESIPGYQHSARQHHVRSPRHSPQKAPQAGEAGKMGFGVRVFCLFRLSVSELKAIFCFWLRA